MTRNWNRPARTPDDERGDNWAYAQDPGPELVGAAEGAPLSQGRGGSLPLELENEGVDLSDPPHRGTEVRGAPTEPALHSPTATHIETRPVATGECTVETLAREPLCEDVEG